MVWLRVVFLSLMLNEQLKFGVFIEKHPTSVCFFAQMEDMLYLCALILVFCYSVGMWMPVF